MALILTKAAIALKRKQEDVEVVTFKAHKRKIKVDNGENVPQKPQLNKKKDLDLKKIRHEVFKFGISGFDSTKKQEAKIALAVSLGAKPPKKEYINYKELMQKRKEEIQKAKVGKDLMMAKAKLHSAGKPRKTKSANNDVGHFLSSYGKVQKKDIKKDEPSAKKKKKR